MANSIIEGLTTVLAQRIASELMLGSKPNAHRRIEEMLEFSDVLARASKRVQDKKIGSLTFELISEATDVIFFSKATDVNALELVARGLLEFTMLQTDEIIEAIRFAQQLKAITHKHRID